MYSITENSSLEGCCIEIDNTELNLDKTLKCGQAFRWNKTPKGTWYGTIADKLVALRQIDNKIYTNIKSSDILCLVEYFDLTTDYTAEIGKLDLDNYARQSYEIGKGIHILRQDLFETMVTFLMSQCNTMHNIKLIVNKLSVRFGNKVQINWNNENIEYYTFPTLEQLRQATLADLRACGMGFRAEYLMQMINKLDTNKNALDSLRACSYTEAIKELTKFNGVGNKVANCIALFGLHHVNAFPIDTHIKQIINKEYNGCIDIKRYGQYAGIIQQYMFYNKTGGDN